MSAQELGGRVDHDVRAVLDGADQIGRAESVVDDQGDIVAVSQCRQGVDVGDIAVGVAESLDVDSLGVGLNRRLDLIEVVNVNEGGVNAVKR